MPQPLRLASLFPRSLASPLRHCAFAVLTASLLSACGSDDNGGLEPLALDTEPPFPTLAAHSIPPGLHATISDSLELSISGPGVYSRVPLRRQRPGYHYLADGQSDDGYEVILILPLAATPGVYLFSSTDPFHIGSDYSAKVESVEHGSFHLNLEGVLTLNQLQSVDNHHTLASGTFSFAAENEQGQRIVVDGSFNLQPET